MIPYYIDQQQKAAQIDAAAERYQEQWEDGFDDALNDQWNCCQRKSPDCERYCAYLAGYNWGLKQKAKGLLSVNRSGEDYEF